MSDQPAYRYPDTHEERLAWHLKGTPAPWTPYTPQAPDALRDGLLRGYREHVEKRR